jgi:hypothetical protein
VRFCIAERIAGIAGIAVLMCGKTLQALQVDRGRNAVQAVQGMGANCGEELQDELQAGECRHCRGGSELSERGVQDELQGVQI